MKKTVLIFFILIMFPCQGLAYNVTKTNRLFDWAEQSFPQYFSPAGAETFLAEGFLARYYEDTDTYIATLDDHVFLYGDVFGGLVYAGQLDDYDQYLPPPMLQLSFSDIQPYLPVIEMVGSLGYAIYQNDGEITTGLIMRTLNPMGEVLKNQEYMINLLGTMVGTLQDIENKLAAIDEKLNTVLLEIQLSKSEILGSINDPHEYISNIDSYEKELRQLADRNAPLSADKNQLDDLADNILDYGPDGVFNQVNQIHNAITASQSGREPVLKNFTDQLILKIAESTDINRYENAYQALENYTMKLISGEVRGANLLVDAHLYRGEKDAASQVNDMLQKNIQEIMSFEPYGFMYNAARLMMNFADPYYDAPGHSGKFIPAAAENIFKQAEFLKHRLAKNDKVLVFYSITEAGEGVPDLLLGKSDGSHVPLSPKSITSYLIQGKGYDNWDDRTMKFNNQYQLTVGTFILEREGWGARDDYYVRSQIPGHLVKYYDNIKVQNYRQDMVADTAGGISFGFFLTAKRNSHRLDTLQWQECGSSVDYNHFNDSLMDAIVAGMEDEFLNNPLGHGVWLKTTCDEWDDGDCINNTNDYPTGDISLCTSFTYGGTSERQVTMDTILYRRLIVDAENDHCCGTDGDAWGHVKLYVRDEDDGINYVLYENPGDQQHVQGWHYDYQNSEHHSKDFKLVPGHHYHMRIHLYGHIEQGLRSRNGYVELRINTEEPIRFIFNE